MPQNREYSENTFLSEYRKDILKEMFVHSDILDISTIP